ncbi:hypothetical protein [Candidatus Leptofilum sp.]|uniref:hypothetical protein n=1 Tax=Candidatus Leptofilum sp. TaxID=3241576 RepID=UPI003B596A99
MRYALLHLYQAGAVLYPVGTDGALTPLAPFDFSRASNEFFFLANALVRNGRFPNNQHS